MTLHRSCCCADRVPYYVFQVCHFGSTTSLCMSSTDFATCGFSSGTVYEYDPGSPVTPSCGTWVESTVQIGTLLDSTYCDDFSAFASCCDCLGESDACCSYDDCLIYRNANGLPVGLTLTGYLGGSGGGNCYDFEILTLSTSTPTFELSGYSDFRITVSGEILVTPSCSSSTYTCDELSTPGERTLPFSFDVVIVCPAFRAPTKLGRLTYPGDICDNSELVCPDATDDTLDTAGAFAACDRWFFSPQGGSTLPVPLSTVPTFSSSCSITGSTAFAVSVPFQVLLIQGNATLPDCEACDTDGIWHGEYFPDVAESATLTIQGAWS